MPLGYDIKEEATEIKTELKNSRNTFFIAGAGVVAYLVRDRINDWWDSRNEEEEE